MYQYRVYEYNDDFGWIKRLERSVYVAGTGKNRLAPLTEAEALAVVKGGVSLLQSIGVYRQLRQERWETK